MKKVLATITPAITLLTAAPSVFAATTVSTCPAGSFSGLCNVGFSDVIPALITTLFILGIIVALFYLIWGGFKWLTSGGDKQAVQAAREHIIAAIIGLVIIFLAYFILNIVIGFFLPGTSLGTFTLPSI